MNGSIPFIGVWALLVLVTCTVSDAQAGEPNSMRKMLIQYETAGQGVAESVEFISAPLRALSPEQKASVAALVLMTKVAAQSHSVEGISNTHLAEEYWRHLARVVPLPVDVSSSFGPCLDEHIAYGVAMARCLEDGNKSEDECDRESSAESAAVIMCMMGELEQLEGALRRIEGRNWPDIQLPWREGTRPIE